MHTTDCTNAHHRMYQCTPQNVPMHTTDCTNAHHRLYQCTPQTVPMHTTDCTNAHHRPYQCTPQTVPIHTTDRTNAHHRLYQCTPQTVHRSRVTLPLAFVLNCTILTKFSRWRRNIFLLSRSVGRPVGRFLWPIVYKIKETPSFQY